MVGASEERSRKPTLYAIAAAVIILLAVLVAAAIAYRQPIAETLLMRQLRNLGLDQAAFAVSRFDAGVLELENLSIGNGDGLDVERIEAHFSTRGLFASRLDALQISGVRLHGALDEVGVSASGSERSFRTGPGGSFRLSGGGPAPLLEGRLHRAGLPAELSANHGPGR